MSIDEKQVRHIGLLARISLSQEDVELFGHQLSDILQYVDKLNEIDTSDVEPLAHVGDHASVFRDDEPGVSLAPGEAVGNAPDKQGPFFKVPKVIE